MRSGRERFIGVRMPCPEHLINYNEKKETLVEEPGLLIIRQMNAR
jgi:hypothetical protein